MTRLLLALLLAAVGVYGQNNQAPPPDCAPVFGTFTGNGNTVWAANGAGDNRNIGCTTWVVVYEADSTVSAVTVTFQSAPGFTAVPVTGAFVTFAGAAVTGYANPTSTVPGGIISLKNGAVSTPWLRANVSNYTGSGNVRVLFYGYRTGYTGGTGTAGGGGAGTPCTTTALSLQYNAAGSFGCIINWTANGSNVFLTAIAAPATPAAGKGVPYLDSTSKNLAIKNDAGTVNHGVQTAAAVLHNFLTSISDAGAVGQAQPACGDLSDAGAGCTGTGTNSVFTGSTATAPVFSATPTFSLADVSVKSPVRVEPGTLTGNVTSVTFTNKTAGAKFSIAWTQDGTGGRTVAYGASAVNTCAAIDPTPGATTTQNFEVGSDGATVNGTGCTTTSILFNTNAQTSTYQVLASDFLLSKTIIVASGTFTITLVATATQPGAGQSIKVINYGSGVVTIARSGQNINGGTTSLTLPASSATVPSQAFVISNGTDYFSSLDTATSQNSKARSLNFIFDGGSTAVVTGNTTAQTVPFACTISAYNISVQATDTATFKLWKIATGTAIPTVANSINTSGVALSSGTSVHSTTVSDFTTTAVAANDIVIGQLSAVGGVATWVSVGIQCDAS